MESVWAPNQGYDCCPLPLQSTPPRAPHGSRVELGVEALTGAGMGQEEEGSEVLLRIASRSPHTHPQHPASTSSSVKWVVQAETGGRRDGTHHRRCRGWPSLGPGTLSGKASKLVRTGSRQPNLADLKRRMMSWSVAATTKYSCFSRSSFPSKNWGQCQAGWSQGGGLTLLWVWPGETPTHTKIPEPRAAPPQGPRGLSPTKKQQCGW